MEEEKRRHLEDAITKLPVYDAPEAIWEAIETKLDSKEEQGKGSLYTAIAQLPQIEAPESVWNGVEDSLRSNSTGKLRRLYPYISIAASFLLLLGIGLYLIRGEHNEKATISYSVETVEEFKTFPKIKADESYEIELAHFINSECKKLPNVCNSPQFVFLQNEVQKLDKELQYLSTQATRQKENTQVLKYMAEVQKQKATMYKKILSLMI